MQSQSSSSSAMRNDVFFTGTAHEAIELCKEKRKLLLVFLHGLCDGESIRADAAVHHALQSHSNILALRLYDDLNNTDPYAYEDAKYLREIFPSINTLPFLLILNQEGDSVAQLEGYEVAEGIDETLLEAATHFQAGEEDSSMQSHETGYRDNPSPSRSPKVEQSSFPAFPEFPSFGESSLGQSSFGHSNFRHRPSWGQNPQPLSPHQTPSFSPAFSGSNFSGTSAFNQSGANTFPNHNSGFGDFSQPQTSSTSTSSVSRSRGAITPFPFSAPQFAGQPSSLITNFPSTQAISMAEAISKASSQAATAAAGDAYDRGQQPQQTTTIAQSPSSYFSQHGVDSQDPTPLASPKADMVQDVYSNTANGVPDVQPQQTEPQLHGSQSLSAFEDTLEPNHSLPAHSSVFECAEAQSQADSVPHQNNSIPDFYPESQQPQQRSQYDNNPGYTNNSFQGDASPQDHELPSHTDANPLSSHAGTVPGSVNNGDYDQNNLTTHHSAPISPESTDWAGRGQGKIPEDTAHVPRGYVHSHEEEAKLGQDRLPPRSSHPNSLPTMAHRSPNAEVAPEPQADMTPQAPATPQIRSNSRVSTDRPTDVFNKYRRSTADSPPTSPRQSDTPTPFFGGQRLSYRRSQDSLPSSPKAAEIPSEDDRSVQGYATDSSSPKSQATLANGVTGTSHTPNNAAQLLLSLTAQGRSSQNAHPREDVHTSRRPASFDRDSWQGTSEAFAPKSAFETSAHSSGFDAHGNELPTFRDMPNSRHSERAEDRIAEASNVQDRNIATPGSPKAAAARQIFASTGSGSLDSDGKPLSRHKQRSPRRSSSLRRKAVQRGYEAYGPGGQGEAASFKGFDTASHRHTSPITSPRAPKATEQLPHFEIFKFSDSDYKSAHPDHQQAFQKEQHEIEMESPEKKLRLQQMDVTPLPDREHDTSEAKPSVQQAAISRAGMMSMAVGNMQLYLGALLVIVLGFLSGLFSMGAKQIVHVTPGAVKEAITQPFQLIGNQAREDNHQAAEEAKLGPREKTKSIERRRTS